MPRHTLDKISLPIRTVIVCTASLILSLLLCLIASIVSKNSDDPTSHLTLYGEICFLMSMLFCGFSGAKIAKEKRFASGMLSGTAILIVIFVLSLFLSHERFLKRIIILALGAFASATGSALGASEKKRKRRK